MTHVDIEQPTSKWYPMIQKKYVILCICISSTKCIIVLGTFWLCANAVYCSYTVYLKAQALKDEEGIRSHSV